MTTTPTSIDAVQAYFDAWNRRDPEGIVATFTANGTYSDPATAGDLSGKAIAGYAEALFGGFPDLSFEIGEVRRNGDETVIADWIMRGTNLGSLGGKPPSGGSFALPGIDVIRMVEGGIASVRGYFDRQSMLEQLGLQVLVLPYRIGAVSFGPAMHMETEDRGLPGAMSLTMIEVRTDAEALQVREDTRRIMPELARMQGFLGFTTVQAGRRLYTMTAWANPDDPRQLCTGLHADSMRRVYADEIGVAGLTGIWVPERLVRRVRCTACNRWEKTEGPESCCGCGERLPEPPVAW